MIFIIWDWLLINFVEISANSSMCVSAVNFDKNSLLFKYLVLPFLSVIWFLNFAFPSVSLVIVNISPFSVFT